MNACMRWPIFGSFAKSAKKPSRDDIIIGRDCGPEVPRGAWYGPVLAPSCSTEGRESFDGRLDWPFCSHTTRLGQTMFLYRSSSRRPRFSCVHLLNDIQGSVVVASLLVSFWRHNRRQSYTPQTGSAASFGRTSHCLPISLVFLLCSSGNKLLSRSSDQCARQNAHQRCPRRRLYRRLYRIDPRKVSRSEQQQVIVIYFPTFTSQD